MDRTSGMGLRIVFYEHNKLRPYCTHPSLPRLPPLLLGWRRGCPGLGLLLDVATSRDDPLVEDDEAIVNTLFEKGLNGALLSVHVFAIGPERVAGVDDELPTSPHDASDRNDTPVPRNAGALVDLACALKELLDVGLVIHHHTMGDDDVVAIDERDVVASGVLDHVHHVVVVAGRTLLVLLLGLLLALALLLLVLLALLLRAGVGGRGVAFGGLRVGVGVLRT